LHGEIQYFISLPRKQGDPLVVAFVKPYLKRGSAEGFDVVCETKSTNSIVVTLDDLYEKTVWASVPETPQTFTVHRISSL